MFYQRLDNILIQHGFCSKRTVKNFIKNNSVFVNASQVFDSKIYINTEKDSIVIEENVLKISHLYLMMNKPAGFVCSSVSDRSFVIYNLLEKYKTNPLFKNLHSIGRLDKDTEGLLLFTTNGDFSNFITRKDNEITKKYYVELAKVVSKEKQNDFVKQFQKGIFVPQKKKSNSFMTKPALLEWISEKSCYITITEGKFHQIKRMINVIQNDVTYLKRVAIGSLFLDDSLKQGKVKKISKNDIENLLK